MSMSVSARAAPYRDPKRYAWLFSLLMPSLVGAGPALYLATGRVWTLWIPVFLSYVVVPLLDWRLGDDRSNPPETAVPGLEADRYYRVITWLLVPVLWAAFTFGVWFAATHDLPWWGVFAVVLTTGAVGGYAINLGHEFGHKSGAFETWLARLILAPSGYGHFTIEHNLGHHRDVATPGDPASARMGESIWAFVLREMPGAFRRAWSIEASRLRRRGDRVWSLNNRILQPALATAVFWAALVAWLGAGAMPALVLISFWANFQLTSANYVEHYGLLRQTQADGTFERPQPRHSWNSNHIVSNWMVFHLQRHSDHHAHPSRRYQSLRHFEEAPQLPSGYFGMFLAAYVPPFWFWLMDRRLVAVAQGDASRINFSPGKRDKLIRRYRLQTSGSAD